MRSLVGRLVIVLALFVVAGFAAREARRLERAADTHERFATLRFDSGDGDLDRAVADYWQRRYDRVAAGASSPDSQVLLLAANAAYRATQQAAAPARRSLGEGGPRQMPSQQLDAVLQAYATVLKAETFLPDAAYNYEYVARIRDSLGRKGAVPSPKLADDPGRAEAGDLPAGPTIHGRPGGPPPGTKGEEFEILTPMEFGDREAQPEPTAGGRPPRKG